MRKKLMFCSEKHHMLIHLLFGIFSVAIIYFLDPSVNLYKASFLAALFTFLPDIDHLFFIFIYGRHSNYASKIRAFLGSKEIKKVIDFCKTNHKNNTQIYSHNFVSLFLTLLLFYYFLTIGKIYWSTVFLSWSMHYIFDLLEDLLFFSKVNPNWWLKFGEKRS
jgi:hypothetical protein